MQREFIEWTNGWREDANCPKKRRWLIIGDSVAREWRGRLQEMVSSVNISIDFFATSLQLEDPAFFKELMHFISFDEYRYEFIFVNWGGHHGLSRSCAENEQIYFSYKTHYENMVNYLRETALLKEKFARIIIISSTPVVLANDTDKFDNVKNKEIFTRNKIAYELATQHNFLYIDHFGFVFNNRKNFPYADGFHFKYREESIMLAGIILNVLIQNKIITEKGEIIGSGHN